MAASSEIVGWCWVVWERPGVAPGVVFVDADHGCGAHGVGVAVSSASAVDLHHHFVDHDAATTGCR